MTSNHSITQALSASLDSSNNSKRERRLKAIRISAMDSHKVPPQQFSRRHDAYLLERNDSRSLQGTPVAIETNFENRIYSLQIVCGPDYPSKPPSVVFSNKVNLPSVNQANGRVENLGLLKAWKETTTIENILVGLKNEMVANKGLKQPPEDAYY